ncbi:MAG: metal-dependent transcriptional regulator [Candidatus Lokiarchaeota archaeon]|nr:metal-dependent transcriptional regulator [Candidatus Harpocratesius repetitus]
MTKKHSKSTSTSKTPSSSSQFSSSSQNDSSNPSSLSEQKNSSQISYKGITVRNSEYSESFDEYLECIYRLSLRNPAGWVKNNQISKRLQVKAPSVTNMLEKLSKAQLIDWKPRRGIRLTDIGRKRAKEVVFYHSIMEIFLNRILGMTNPEQINKIACDFEHHLTREFSDRLIELMGIHGELKNVDNFIMEDRLPTHIETRPIYSEKAVLEILEKFYFNLKKRIQSNDLSENELNEEYKIILEEIASK